MSDNILRKRAQKLGLYGLIAHWDTFAGQPWVEKLIEAEDEERQRRSHERRLRNAKIGRFKPVSDFDWGWPETVDRAAIDEQPVLAPQVLQIRHDPWPGPAPSAPPRAG